MNGKWRASVQQSCRFIEFATIADIARLQHQHFLFDLSHLAIIRVSGGDALSFLNNQFSNDVSDIADSGCQINAWCNHKGQVISVFILVNIDDIFYILLPEDLSATVAKRLAMFKLRADVTIEDVSGMYILYGANNMETVHYLHTGKEIHFQPGKIIANREPIIIALPDPLNRMIILSGLDSMQSIIDQQAVFFTDTLSWQYLDIKQGIPFITAKTSEQFLPQMLNLDLLAAISLDKGCFPGQEAIARLHYRGTVKRRVIPASTDTEATIGDTVSHGDHTRPIGTVLSSLKKYNKTIMLIVMELPFIRSGGIYLSNKPDRTILLEQPPYRIDTG